MKSDCLISIVMAVYNGEKYLPEQIRSILNQTYRNIELIITDDASPDGSLRIALEFARKDPRITVRQNAKNLGIVRNFLSTLALTRGELICFSDQDDVWRADKLATLASLILKSPKRMLAYSDLEICDADLRRIHSSFWKTSGIRPRNGVLGEFAFLRNIMPGCSMMFRKEIKDILIEMYPKSSFMHDHLAFVLASSRGRVVYSREPLVKYRQHSQNNIGAFYPSVADFNRFSEQLQREIALLKPVLPVDLTALERFLNANDRKKLSHRLAFLRFYLWLRKDSLFSKCLGLFECLAPKFYQQCCRGFHAHRAM